ncbi:hypothetical protein WKW80_05650 [Variovorax humicola]|uniref:Uncharacterized protein n=1 Tax=Variovorax humicola TaxID=1769758 RepID=A0ABU8VV38_9BURK
MKVPALHAYSPVIQIASTPGDIKRKLFGIVIAKPAPMEQHHHGHVLIAWHDPHWVRIATRRCGLVRKLRVVDPVNFSEKCRGWGYESYERGFCIFCSVPRGTFAQFLEPCEPVHAAPRGLTS